MPRNSSTGVYARPVGTDAVPDTTIESTKYNNNVADVEQDLNAPRPIVAGGTGASDAATAMNNLGGELARQVITNYDSAPFQAGSFYSAAGATSAPSANAFTGICYSSSATNTDLFIEARDQTTSTLYVRQKIAGVWQGWSVPAGVSAGPAPPPSTLPNSLWWDSTRGKLFIYYKDVNSSQWVEAVAVPDIDANTFVEIAGDTMTGLLTLSGNAVNALHAVPKQQLDAVSVAAAPLDALAYSGMQVNGSMEVSQEKGTTATVSPAFSYVVDGWKLSTGAGGSVSAAQFLSGVVPGITGFINIAVGTALPTLAAGDLVTLYQAIEGYRISRLAWGTPNARPLTIGFWTIHSLVGTYSGTVSGGGGRTYAFTYTQNTANAPEFKTVTIPGDTAGTWVVNNGSGLQLSFTMAAGATYTAPSANAWVAGSYFAAPGQVNAVGSLSNSFRITGVVVLPGIQVPSAARAPLIMRPFDQELLTCKRYYTRLVNSAMGSGTGVSYALVPFFFPVAMRAVPTMANLNPGSISNASLVTAAATTATGGYFQINITAANGYILNREDAYDARL